MKPAAGSQSDAEPSESEQPAQADDTDSVSIIEDSKTGMQVPSKPTRSRTTLRSHNSSTEKVTDAMSSPAQEKSTADADVTSSRASATKSQREVSNNTNVEQSGPSSISKGSDVALAKSSASGVANEQDRSSDVEPSSDKRSRSSKTSISQLYFQCLQRSSEVGK